LLFMFSFIELYFVNLLLVVFACCCCLIKIVLV